MKRIITLILVIVFAFAGYGTKPPVVQAATDGTGFGRTDADTAIAAYNIAKGTSTTYPVHGPFSTPTGFKLVPRHPEKPAIQFEDEAVLGIKPIGKPSATPSRIGNDPGESTIATGDIPKVFSGFDVSKTGLETSDLQSAASHTHVVITSYHKITFWTRDGTLLSEMETKDFFQPVKDDMNKVLKDPADATKMLSAQYPVNEFYDNRLIFDTYRNRFWLVSLTRNMSPGSPNAAHRVTLSSIAISKTENPQDGFNMYWTNPCRDYQAIGLSKKLFVIGYSSGVNFPEFGIMAAFDAAALAKGAANQSATVLGNFKNPDGSPASAYMQPALQYGDSFHDLQFFVSNPGDGKTNIVWALDPTKLDQLLQVGVPVAATTYAKTSPQASNADIAHSQRVWGSNGGGPPYRENGSVLKTIYRNNKLYWVWDDAIPGDSREISFIRLNRVDVGVFPADLLFSQGTPKIDRRFGTRNGADPVNSVFSYYMPSLAVNKDGTMVVTYSRSGATIFPETRYSVYFEKESDIRPSQVVQKGDYPIGQEDANYNLATDNRAAAGRFDYNGSALDPLDERSVWMIDVAATKSSPGQGTYKLVVRRIPFNSAP